jgi:hypothetical protein
MKTIYIGSGSGRRTPLSRRSGTSLPRGSLLWEENPSVPLTRDISPKGAIILWYLPELHLNNVDFSPLGGNKRGCISRNKFL